MLKSVPKGMRKEGKKTTRGERKHTGSTFLVSFFVSSTLGPSATDFVLRDELGTTIRLSTRSKLLVEWGVGVDILLDVGGVGAL